MKRIINVCVCLGIFLALMSCAGNKGVAKIEKKIVGHYEYVHSWDYVGPDGGKMHCDESGTLDFYRDGSFSDTATQHHVRYIDEQMRDLYDFKYYCQGRWKVEGGKFVFKELAEGFDMVPMEVWPKKKASYALQLKQQSIPNSDRWIVFDIERLDKEWFIWSYTYPNGRKDTLDMHRVN